MIIDPSQSLIGFSKEPIIDNVRSIINKCSKCGQFEVDAKTVLTVERICITLIRSKSKHDDKNNDVITKYKMGLKLSQEKKVELSSKEISILVILAKELLNCEVAGSFISIIDPAALT